MTFDPHTFVEDLRQKREQEDAKKKTNGASSAAPIKAVTASELLSLELPPRESVLGPWLCSKSLAMIYGPRGEGKTYIALGTAIAIATGGKFLCWEAPTPRRVLLIDGEMPAEVLQERIASLAGGKNLEHLRIITPDLQSVAMPNVAAEDGQIALGELVASADVVIIDNLACLARSGDENERAPWLVLQQWLLALRSQGKSVVLVHHSGKGGDQRGTSAREDVLDTVVRLRRPRDYREEDGLRAEWSFAKHRGFYGDDAGAIEVQLITGQRGELTWAWQSLDTSLVAQVADMINDTEMTLREIAKELDLSLSRVFRLKKRAEAAGLINEKAARKKRNSE